MSKILADPQTSNIKALEEIISEVKNNAFDRIKIEIEEKTKEKNQIMKNIDLIKSHLKLNHMENKNSMKSQFSLVTQNKQLKAVETRLNNEHFVGSELDEIKNDISKYKYDYERIMEENRYLRTEMLNDDKSTNLIKEDIKKLNKMNSDAIKERDNIKSNILQLQKHIILMKEKVSTIDIKNKDLLMQFYALSLDQ